MNLAVVLPSVATSAHFRRRLRQEHRMLFISAGARKSRTSRTTGICGAASIPLALVAQARAADILAPPVSIEALAEAEAPLFDATFGVIGTTDYVFRGISQTDEGPAVQPFAEARYGMFYAGTFLSNVDFNAPDPDTEVDFSFGLRPTWAGISFDFGGIYYMYPMIP
jgi:hypothetical protein